MSRKLVIMFLAVMLLSICIVRIPSVSALTRETTVDFLWGFEYEGEASAPRLDLSTIATNIVKNAFGSGYSATVYIEAGLAYNFSFGLHTPYQASMYLSSINPRVEQSTMGYISLMPEKIFFNVLASSKLYLKVGAIIFLHGMKMLGSEYIFDEIDFNFTQTIDTDYPSPLGTYRISIGELIENTIGKILPKIELVIGLGVGAVFAIPLDWDLELVFQSQMDATSGTNQILSVSPSNLTFNQSGSLPFAITPRAGGQESIRWNFTQRISGGLDFYIRSKIVADIAAGIAVSYESPEISMKVLSTGLSTLSTKTLSNALNADLSVPLPQLKATLSSIGSAIENTTLKIFVNDETQNCISGAEVDVITSQESYSATDLGEGYYSATVQTSELSSVQISVTKSGYEGFTTKVDIETECLHDYNEIAGELDVVNSTLEQLETDNYSLENQFNDYQQTHSYTNSQYESLQDNHEDLKSKYQEVREPATIRNLMYVFITSTIVFIATTGYFATRKPKVKAT